MLTCSPLLCARAKRATLDYHALWKIDVKTGEVSFPKTRKRYSPQVKDGGSRRIGKRGSFVSGETPESNNFAGQMIC